MNRELSRDGELEGLRERVAHLEALLATRPDIVAPDFDPPRSATIPLARHAAVVGESDALTKLEEQIAAVAPTDATVLITGESGVGKELVATAIHRGSPRSDRPMIRVSCASIAPSLFESEFFGHVRGAFTGAVTQRSGRFELAQGGTLLLDEVGEIPMEQQSKLLRVLQEAEFERVGESHTRSLDVRIVAATAADLRERCRAGTFREDLFYRLSVFPIHIPPLRERRADIVPLVRHYLVHHCQRMRVSNFTLSPAQICALEAYDWPGNVRELQNVTERAVIVARASHGLRFDMPEHSGGEIAVLDPTVLVPEPTLADVALLERTVILAALEAAQWRIYGPGGAADALGLRPTTLASRMKRMGLSKP